MKKDRRSGHFGKFSASQKSSNVPQRCAIFGKRSSQIACSGRGFCFGSFLNSTRWHCCSGPMKRSSGMPLCPFFSSLHAIQPQRRACSLHLRSSASSSCFTVSSFRYSKSAIIRVVIKEPRFFSASAKIRAPFYTASSTHILFLSWYCFVTISANVPRVSSTPPFGISRNPIRFRGVR